MGREGGVGPGGWSPGGGRGGVRRPPGCGMGHGDRMGQWGLQHLRWGQGCEGAAVIQEGVMGVHTRVYVRSLPCPRLAHRAWARGPVPPLP